MHVHLSYLFPSLEKFNVRSKAESKGGGERENERKRVREREREREVSGRLALRKSE